MSFVPLVQLKVAAVISAVVGTGVICTYIDLVAIFQAYLSSISDVVVKIKESNKGCWLHQKDLLLLTSYSLIVK